MNFKPSDPLTWKHTYTRIYWQSTLKKMLAHSSVIWFVESLDQRASLFQVVVPDPLQVINWLHDKLVLQSTSSCSLRLTAVSLVFRTYLMRWRSICFTDFVITSKTWQFTEYLTHISETVHNNLVTLSKLIEELICQNSVTFPWHQHERSKKEKARTRFSHREEAPFEAP